MSITDTDNLCNEKIENPTNTNDLIFDNQFDKLMKEYQSSQNNVVKLIKIDMDDIKQHLECISDLTHPLIQLKQQSLKLYLDESNRCAKYTFKRYQLNHVCINMMYDKERNESDISAELKKYGIKTFWIQIQSNSIQLQFDNMKHSTNLYSNKQIADLAINHLFTKIFPNNINYSERLRSKIKEDGQKEFSINILALFNDSINYQTMNKRIRFYNIGQYHSYIQIKNELIKLGINDVKQQDKRQKQIRIEIQNQEILVYWTGSFKIIQRNNKIYMQLKDQELFQKLIKQLQIDFKSYINLD